MHDDIERVLIDRATIERRLGEVAAQIVADFDARRGNGSGGELTLVPILTGSIIFVADLIRKLPVRMQIHLVSVSSYPSTSTTSRGARIRAELTNLPQGLQGAHVLVIDDILDSGHTMRMVTDLIAGLQPASLRTCVLLHKRRSESADVRADYVCFEIPDRFVVGYGLDYNDYYRNLPKIVVLRPEAVRQER